MIFGSTLENVDSSSICILPDVVFDAVFTVAVKSSKSVMVSLVEKVPDTFESSKVTNVFPWYLFSVMSLFAPAKPTAVVFAVKMKSWRTSVFAVGSVGAAGSGYVSPLIVFAGTNGSEIVGVV